MGHLKLNSTSTLIELFCNLPPLCSHVRIVVVDMAFPYPSVIGMGGLDGEAADVLRHPVNQSAAVIGRVGIQQRVIVTTSILGII
jgi:hypothetical protein